MKTYLFPSKSNPAIQHQTTVQNDGSITCSCPARVECWHVKRVRTNPPIDLRVSQKDQRAIRALVDEGADAEAYVRDLFPSISEEETQELINTIVLAELDEDLI